MNDLSDSKNKFMTVIFVNAVLLLITGALMLNDEVGSHRLQATAAKVSAYVEKLNEQNKVKTSQIYINTNSAPKINIKVETSVKSNTNIGTTQPPKIIWTKPTTPTSVSSDPLYDFKNDPDYIEQQKKIEEIKKKVEDSKKEFCEDNPDTSVCN